MCRAMRLSHNLIAEEPPVKLDVRPAVTPVFLWRLYLSAVNL